MAESVIHGRVVNQPSVSGAAGTVRQRRLRLGVVELEVDELHVLGRQTVTDRVDAGREQLVRTDGHVADDGRRSSAQLGYVLQSCSAPLSTR